MKAASRWALIVVGDDGLTQIVVERDRMVITPIADPIAPAEAVAFRGLSLRGDAAVAAVLAVEASRSCACDRGELAVDRHFVVGIGDWTCRVRQGSGGHLRGPLQVTSVLRVVDLHLSASDVRAIDHLITSARVIEPLIVEGSEPELLLRLREALAAGGGR